MKRSVLLVILVIPSLVFLLLSFSSAQRLYGQSVPELMYFLFNTPGNQQNYASAPVGSNPAILDGLTIGNTGQFGTALIGNGGPIATNRLNTAWATNLPATGWTISLWFNHFPAGNPDPEYLFGDNTASSFRCFVNGVAFDGILLRGGGLDDVLVSGVLPGPSVVHFVYTGTSIKAFLNGVLISTDAQPAITITGAGPFLIGGYEDGIYNIAIPTGSLVDEFRLYNRALTDAEVAATWNSDFSPVVTTLSASAVTTGSATLNGTVNANGMTTSVTFDYGPTAAYGTSVPAIPATVSGSTVTTVGAPVSGLIPNTLYHYRVVGVNAGGTSNGNDMIFDLVPVPSITGPSTACRGSINNKYVTQSGKSNYIWTVSAGGSITAGGTSTSDTVIVTWNTAGAQTVSVNYKNSAGVPAPTPTTYPVTVNPLPVPTITGSGTVCAGTSGVIYTTEPGMSGYTWSVSAGGTITGGGGTNNNTATVTWNTVGTQTVTVNYTNGNGCAAATATLRNVTVNTLPVPTITGSGNVCVGDAGVTYTTEPGMSGYTWSVSAGGTITGGGGTNNNTATVTWNTIGAQTVTVNYTNGNGCTAASATVKNVTVNSLPVPVISGSAAECAGTTGVIYTTETGKTGYTWTVSSGGTITAGTGTNAITVTWNTAGPQTVSVSYSANGCTAASPTIKNVVVNPLPVPTISPVPLLAESFENGGSLPAGWEMQILVPNNTISFLTSTSHPTGFLAYNGNYLVRFNSYDYGNGVIRLKRTIPVSTIGSLNVTVDFAWLESSAYSTANDRVEVEWSLDGVTWTSAGTFPRYNPVQGWKVRTQPLPLSAGGQATLFVAFKFISEFGNDCYLDMAKVYLSNTAVCAGSSASYQTESGMTSYGWTLSSGGTITSGSGTSAITVLWSTPGSKTVGVNYTNSNGCKANVPTVAITTVNPLPIPAISGPVVACVYDTVIYRTQKNMTSYVWSISPGGVIIGSSADSLISVSWNSAGSAGTRWVNVAYTNAIGCTGTSPLPYNVTVSPLPVPTISGPVSICRNNVGTYQTEPAMTGYSWAVSPGGVILTGLGTRTITVRWDSAGNRSITVNYTNASGCNALTPTLLPIVVHPLPVPSLSGSDSVCVTTTGNIYTTEAGMTGYLWTVSPGGVITAGGTATSNFVTITWNSIGSKTVSVTYTNLNGCMPTTPTTFPVLVSPIPSPQMFGPNTACVLSTCTYSTQQMMASYTWSVSAGGTITSITDTSAIAVSWNTAGNQYVIVNYTTPVGCTGAIPDTLPVTVNTRPSPTISGPVSVCEATGGHVYTTEPMNTAYQWTLSSGGTIVSGAGTNIITVTWDSAGTRQVSVNYSNSFGCSALIPTSYNVTVKPRPNPLITGPTPVCKGIPGNNYTTQSGMLNYIWNVSSGNTITSGGTTGSNFIAVTWNVVDTQTVSVNYTATNGCTAQTAKTFKVKVNALPVPAIGGPDTVCVNTAGNLYGTQPGMFIYNWAISTGGTITAGAGTDTIIVTWNLSGPRSVSVNYTDSNGCTAAAPVVYAVNVLALPVPTITGPASVCKGATGKTYTTQAGMTNYVWVVSNGGTVTAGGNDSVNFVTVTWDSAGAQSVSAGYTNPTTGCTSAPLSVYIVTVHPLPSPSITGETSACVDGGNYTYSTENGMTGYSWTTSPSGQIISGQGSYQVQIDWLAEGSQWVGVNYTNGNGCTAGTPSTLSVTVNGVPGQMGAVSGIDTICGVVSGVSYTASPIANATAYNWTVPPGAVITSGAGTTSILVNYPATAASGNVTVTASNACGNGAPSPPLQITVTQIPLPPEIQLQGDMLFSNVPAGNQWFRNGTKIPGATGSTYLVVEEGDYWDKVIINGCASDTSNHIYVIVTGIENPTEGGISLYPNPNDGSFTLRIDFGESAESHVVVTTLLGNRIFETIFRADNGKKEQILDLRPVPGGIYLLTIMHGNQHVQRKILVIP